jgi:hypothetical protein
MSDTIKDAFKDLVLEKVQEHLAERIVSLAMGHSGISHTKIMFDEYLKIIEELRTEL